MKFVPAALQCLYPSLCRGCGIVIPTDDIFCIHCTAKITPLPSRILPLTTSLSLKVFAVSAYVPPVRTLVVKKFNGDVLASQQLARLMLALTPLRTISADYIVPVPLHWTRYASRGFNQAHEMAKIIGRDLNIPVLRLLRRRRKTVFQWKLSGAARQDNVKNAFGLSRWYYFMGTHSLRGKHIVLIDDLCTTGATLSHAAKIIAVCKPASVTAVVGCRAI